MNMICVLEMMYSLCRGPNGCPCNIRPFPCRKHCNISSGSGPTMFLSLKFWILLEVGTWWSFSKKRPDNLHCIENLRFSLFWGPMILLRVIEPMSSLCFGFNGPPCAEEIMILLLLCTFSCCFIFRIRWSSSSLCWGSEALIILLILMIIILLVLRTWGPDNTTPIYDHHHPCVEDLRTWSMIILLLRY